MNCAPSSAFELFKECLALLMSKCMRFTVWQQPKRSSSSLKVTVQCYHTKILHFRCRMTKSSLAFFFFFWFSNIIWAYQLNKSIKKEGRGGLAQSVPQSLNCKALLARLLAANGRAVVTALITSQSPDLFVMQCRRLTVICTDCRSRLQLGLKPQSKGSSGFSSGCINAQWPR